MLLVVHHGSVWFFQKSVVVKKICGCFWDDRSVFVFFLLSVVRFGKLFFFFGCLEFQCRKRHHMIHTACRCWLVASNSRMDQSSQELPSSSHWVTRLLLSVGVSSIVLSLFDLQDHEQEQEEHWFLFVVVLQYIYIHTYIHIDFFKLEEGQRSI